MGETALEFGVGLPQRRFRIGLEMARQIGGGEQEIADFAGDCAVLAGVDLRFDFVQSPRAVWRGRRARSFQSKPTWLAFSCNFSARVRAGRANGTPASAPARFRGRARRLRALRREGAFLRALMRPTSALTRRCGKIAGVGEDMRMAADQLGGDRLDDPAEIEAPGFFAMRA